MWSSCRSSPESCDSTGNGTVIRSAQLLARRPAAHRPSRPANSHWPLRLSQSSRTCCGRGYSGSGLLVSTLSPHGVVSRWVEVFAPCGGSPADGLAADDQAARAVVVRHGPVWFFCTVSPRVTTTLSRCLARPPHRHRRGVRPRPARWPVRSPRPSDTSRRSPPTASAPSSATAKPDREDLEVRRRRESGLRHDLLGEPGARPAQEQVRAADVLEHLEPDVVRLPRHQRHRRAGLLVVPVTAPSGRSPACRR